MKKIITSTLSFIVISYFLLSCSSIKTGTVKSMDIYGSGVIHLPVIVDLEVSEKKIVSSAILKAVDANIEELKKAVIFEGLKKVNADILIEPKFEIISKPDSIIVIVTGFPATYKNFRNIKESDIELLKAGEIQQVNTHEIIKR